MQHNTVQTDKAYRECLDKIYRLGRFGIKLELDTIRNILVRLKSPEKQFKTVHVAGTNGKGSTASYIASILQAAGFKTGVYTSPHLISFNERITINGKQIPNNDVVTAYQAVHRADTGDRKATFFEIATAMAFFYFAREKVEWAVIETGMGGRFDATNIIKPELSVITNLSIEHTDYLGKTIHALAREKAGIIKPKTPVVTAVSQPSGLKVIKNTAGENSSPLYIFKKDFSAKKDRKKETCSYKGINSNFDHLEKPLPGDHQKENMSLALAGCELIFNSLKDSDARYRLDDKLIRQGLGMTKWPGRLEVVRKKPLVIIDGAHNLKAAQVLGKHLSANYGDRQLTLVIGILDDKPFEKMLAHLVPCATRVIVTKAKIDRSLNPEVIMKAVKKLTKKPVMIVEDVQQAVQHALETSADKDVICVAGSLYVAGEAREKFETTINLYKVPNKV